jgi:hypothetical protein
MKKIKWALALLATDNAAGNHLPCPNILVENANPDLTATIQIISPPQTIVIDSSWYYCLTPFVTNMYIWFNT